MAGHFLIYRMSSEDRSNLLARGAILSNPLDHDPTNPAQLNGAGNHFPGWTPASRARLDEVRNGRAVNNSRNILPPHKYLLVPQGSLDVAYLKSRYWLHDVERPTMGNLTDLVIPAQTAWRAGNKAEAIALQVATIAFTSLEIYYWDKKEMV